MINLRPATVSRLRDRLRQAGSRPSVVVTSDHGILARVGILPAAERAACQAVEASVEAMVLMMAADGEVGAAEVDVIRGAVRELTDQAVRTSTLDVMIEGFKEALEWEGPEARLKDIARRIGDDPIYAENTFVLAAVVAFADEVIADQENELLTAFAEVLGIGEERATQLLDELENDWAG